MYNEIKTPTDNRTWQRKQLVKSVKAIKVKYYNHKYGAWTYLTIRDMTDFTNQFLYNVN